MAIISKQYFTIGSQLIGYDDGSQKDFLTDMLGSITAEIDQLGGKTFDGRYKPWGGLLFSTGSASNLSWIGSYGYFYRNLLYSNYYVRRRYYSDICGAWSTRDFLWPSEAAYQYSNSIPILRIDPSGMCATTCCCCPGKPTGFLDRKYFDETVTWDADYWFADGTRGCLHFFGAKLHFDFNWTAIKKGVGDAEMAPCTLNWSEKWSDESKFGHNSGNSEQAINFKNCTNIKKDCTGGGCRILDWPGTCGIRDRVAIAIKKGFKFRNLDVCMKVTLSSTCSTCRSQTQYFKYTSSINVLTGAGSIDFNISNEKDCSMVRPEFT